MWPNQKKKNFPSPAPPPLWAWLNRFDRDPPSELTTLVSVLRCAASSVQEHACAVHSANAAGLANGVSGPTPPPPLS